MSRNIHDLNRSVNKIQENLDRRAQEQGKQAADRFVATTRRGGSFWLIFIYPFSFLFGMAAINTLALKLGFNLSEWVSILGGIGIAGWAGDAWKGK